jgi:hypothetical protein
MRALKILVAVMGIMLVGGFATLIAVIAGRVAHRQQASAPAATAFSGAPIDLPSGARTETMAIGDGKLAVALALQDGTRRIIVIDLASGRQLGAIPLRPAPQ